MLWFKRQPDSKHGSERGNDEVITPVTLAVAMDERIFAQKFAVLQETLTEVGGIDPFLAALGTKTRFFEGLLSPTAIKDLDQGKLELLLETAMPARKRLWPALVEMGETKLIEAVRALLYGKDDLESRLGAFVDSVPEDASADKKTNKKLKRAAHDFAAEMLHFRSPEQYPLMCRWVWDQATLSGAMRELLKGGDTLNHIPLGAGPGVYEAGRAWVAEQLAAQGVYREPHYVVDVFLAHAYADYMRAMSSGMGLMNADFGGKADPMEIVKKLLGIDEARRTGDSRVKKEAVHAK
jgi:hypothetical protein